MYCILRKLKSIAPELNLKAWGASTKANSDQVNDICHVQHGRWKPHDSKICMLNIS